jgi:putative ABC transport system permease protein
MSFLELVTKNILRQRTRAGLTLLGIAAGIATVIALGAITGGLKAASGGLIRSGGSDFILAQEGAADFSFSSLDESLVEQVRARPDVARAAGALLHFTQAGSNPFFMFVGVLPQELALAPPPLVEGRLLAPDAPDEILLGANAAADLDAALGDRVTLGGRKLLVVGIYDTGVLWENGGAYAPLATVQAIAAKPRVVTLVRVVAAPGVDRDTLARRLEDELPGVASISSEADYGKVDQGFQLLDAANTVISLLAVGIGAIGVMNTMIMSVFERTREIGVLRAIGWTARRVLAMIVLESLLLCVLAAFAGAALGLVATRLVLLVPIARHMLDPSFSVELFARGLGVAVLVALAGAAYPAVRAVRLVPMAALRYE